MKIIDIASPNGAKRQPEIINRLSDLFSPDEKKQKAKAEKTVTSLLQRVLDNKYTLLMNVALDGADVPIPMILVGPTGLWVVYPTPKKGVFRAKEDVWEVLDDRSKHFRIARPNLLARTALMARVVNTYLTSHNYPNTEVEPILFFSNPGVHVDTNRPIVRIVLADALDRFAASVLQNRMMFDQETVQRITHAIAGEQTPSFKASLVSENDAFSFRDLPPDSAMRPVKIVKMDTSEPSFLKRIPFTRQQIILLSIMTIFNILLLVAFVVLVLISS
jgi:hypothetical protein